MKREERTAFPVFIKNRDFLEPGEASYSLLAGNGTFFVKNMGLYSSSIRLDAGLPGLLNHDEGVRLRFGRVPRPLMCTILGFFRTAMRWHAGEAIVFLYYSARERSFCAKAPPQRVYRQICSCGTFTEPFVEYDTCDRPQGFIKLGTIHSHCDFRACHSVTDQCDEKYEDGLHITVGRLLGDQPDISVSFVVNGIRFKLRAADVLDSYGNYVCTDPPASWMSQVECVIHGHGTITRKKWGDESPKNKVAAL